MSLLGLDVGTTGCKAVAFDEAGAMIARAYREYPILNPKPGFYELDPNLVWSHLRDCIQEVNAEISSDPVSALAISAQGEAIIPVTKGGEALANSPISSDSRAVQQIAQLEEQLGLERIYDITGQPLSTLSTLPKIMWWKEHNQWLFQNTWKFLCYGDFVLMRFGFQPVIDYTMAARTLAFDIRTLEWSDLMLAIAGISKERLATPLPSGSIIGELPLMVEQELEFTDRVQVVTGGHDQPCAALGAGVVQPGEVLYSIGTTEAIATVTCQANKTLQQHNIPCYPHVVPDTFITLSGNQTGGRLLRWYRDVLGAAERDNAKQLERDVYDVIVEQLDDTPGQLLLLPYFSGSGSLYNDSSATGVIMGLTFDTQRKDIVKAILEGVTYEQALGLRYLRDAGIEVNHLSAVGGGARSDIWLQIKADIMDLPIKAIQIHEAASFGAVLLAGWATGVFADVSQTSQALVSIRKEFLPRPKHTSHHQSRLATYASLYPVLCHIFPAL
jgi:xylulokinase